MNSTAFRWLIYTELLLALREPAAMFMSIILPLAVFLALGFSVGDIEIPVDREGGGVDMFHLRDVLLAGNIAWVTAVFGIVGVAADAGGVSTTWGVPALQGHANAGLHVDNCAIGGGRGGNRGIARPDAGGGMAGIRNSLRRQRGVDRAGDTRLVYGFRGSRHGHHVPHP